MILTFDFFFLFYTRPDLINFDELIPEDHIGNLNNAFDVAQDRLGIAKILDPEGEII